MATYTALEDPLRKRTSNIQIALLIVSTISFLILAFWSTCGIIGAFMVKEKVVPNVIHYEREIEKIYKNYPELDFKGILENIIKFKDEMEQHMKLTKMMYQILLKNEK